MHFFLYSNVKKKKKKKKKCKFDGPFSVQDPNCLSILLMRVLFTSEITFFLGIWAYK